MGGVLRTRAGTQAITDIWFESSERFSEYLFNGEEKGVGRLSAFIEDGRILSEKEHVRRSAREIDKMARRALFAMLIPVAWQMSGKDLGPCIVPPNGSSLSATGLLTFVIF